MKMSGDKSTLKLNLELRKKIGFSGFKNHEDFVQQAGLFEGLKITAKDLRAKAWKRS